MGYPYRSHRYLNDFFFTKSGLVFTQFWAFEATFVVHGQYFPKIVCIFYFTQNDRPEHMVFTKKIGLKTTHSWMRYWRKIRIGWRFCLACYVEKHFCKFPGHRVSFFHRFLRWNPEIEMIVLRTIKDTNGVENLWKFCPQTSTIVSKTQNCGKTKPDLAKRLFIMVYVSPNKVESGKIFSLKHREGFKKKKKIVEFSTQSYVL